MKRRLLCGVVVGMCCWLAAGLATGAESSDALLRRGSQLRREGKNKEALHLFRQALTLEETPRAHAQVGVTLQSLGHWVEAEEHLRRALASAEDPYIRKNREVLEVSLRRVEQQLGSLKLYGGQPGAEVLVGGKRRAVLPLSDPLRVLPGRLHVEVRAPGYQVWQRFLIVEPGQLVNEPVRLVRVDAAPAAGAPAVTQPTPAQSRGSEANEHAGAWQRPIAFVGVGLGAALVGAGIGTLVVSNRRLGRYRDECNPFPTGADRAESCRADYDSGFALRHTAIGTFVSGGVLVATGASILLWRHLKQRSQSNVRQHRQRAARGFLGCAPDLDSSAVSHFGIRCGGYF